MLINCQLHLLFLHFLKLTNFKYKYFISLYIAIKTVLKNGNNIIINRSACCFVLNLYELDWSSKIIFVRIEHILDNKSHRVVIQLTSEEILNTLRNASCRNTSIAARQRYRVIIVFLTFDALRAIVIGSWMHIVLVWLVQPWTTLSRSLRATAKSPSMPLARRWKQSFWLRSLSRLKSNSMV